MLGTWPQVRDNGTPLYLYFKLAIKRLCRGDFAAGFWSKLFQIILTASHFAATKNSAEGIENQWSVKRCMRMRKRRRGITVGITLVPRVFVPLDQGSGNERSIRQACAVRNEDSTYENESASHRLKKQNKTKNNIIMNVNGPATSGYQA